MKTDDVIVHGVKDVYWEDRHGIYHRSANRARR